MATNCFVQDLLILDITKLFISQNLHNFFSPGSDWFLASSFGIIHRRDGLGPTRVTLLAVFIFPEVFLPCVSPVLGVNVEEVPLVPNTFFALAVVGFIKLEPLVRLAAAILAVLGNVLMLTDLETGPGVVPCRLVVDDAWPGPDIVPVRSDPLRDMLFVTELREAEELDLLRFSFELVGRPLAVTDPFFVITGVEFVGFLKLVTELEVLIVPLDNRAFPFIVDVDFFAGVFELVLLRDLVEEFILG